MVILSNLTEFIKKADTAGNDFRAGGGSGDIGRYGLGLGDRKDRRALRVLSRCRRTALSSH
jgi:hypothetical protein